MIRPLPKPIPLRAPLALLALGVLAYAAPAWAKAPPPGYGPSLPADAGPTHPADGSIFNVNALYAPLIEGNRAYSVGDLINITLSETTSTTKSAATKTSRTGGA